MYKSCFWACFGILLFGNGLRAQGPDSTIEVRLKLIQQTSGTGIALSVSVTNHSQQDIYIPDFENNVAYGGIHFYQLEGGKWLQINVISHDYERPPSVTRVNGGTRDSYFIPRNTQNAITASYELHEKKAMKTQDSIIAAYANQPGQIKHAEGLYKMYHPLFLKAGQTLNEFAIYNIDYFRDKNMEYKIGYQMPEYPRFKAGDSTIDDKTHFYFPEYIFTYKRYFPKGVLSNTIYYSTIDLLNIKN
jgi:hypothetical protein